VRQIRAAAKQAAVSSSTLMATAAPDRPFGISDVTGEAKPAARMLRGVVAVPTAVFIQLGLHNPMQPHLTVTTQHPSASVQREILVKQRFRHLYVRISAKRNAPSPAATDRAPISPSPNPPRMQTARPAKR
jgi:hypothetical protein